MKIIDTQWHEPAPWLDWGTRDIETRQKIMTETLLASIDSVGVDAVLIFPIEDLEWSEALSSQYPDRFGVVPMIAAADPAGPGRIALQPQSPDIEKCIAAACRRPGVVAIRVISGFSDMETERLMSGSLSNCFDAISREGLPLFLTITGHSEIAASLAEAYPKMTIIIDHMGIRQGPLEEEDAPKWKKLPEVLALARYPNVAVKLCGAPALSEEAFPYRDIWPQLRCIVDTFGPERLMWASDIPRFRGRIGWRMRVAHAEAWYQGKHTYAESLALYRYTELLSESEKEQILGGSARRLLGWPEGL